MTYLIHAQNLVSQKSKPRHCIIRQGAEFGTLRICQENQLDLSPPKYYVTTLFRTVTEW